MLIVIKHQSGELFKVNESDLVGGDEQLIPLYELDGKKRTRADAWMGDGKPSEITRGNARSGREEYSHYG